MAITSMTDAFRKYGASLVNPQWAVSAIASDGSCVISCWAHHIKSHNGKLRLIDTLSRWKHNSAGNNLLRQHLEEATDKNLDIHLVLVRTDETEVVDAGGDASKVKKSFSVRQDIIGKLVEFDGDKFVIDFVRAKT